MTFKVSIGGDNIDVFLKDLAEEELEFRLSTYQEEVKKRTPIDTGRARRGWQKRKNKVSNEVPYISRLESGYSRQAPRGFVNQAVQATINKRKP